MKVNEIKKVAVLGAGVMGPGLAQIYAQYGCDVVLYSRRQETLRTAISVVRNNLQTQVEVGSLQSEKAEAALKKITLTDSVQEAATGAQYIVETIVEDEESKSKLYAELDTICDADTIIASNTSALNIFKVMVPGRKKNTIIAHFVAPPDLIPLVEIVRGPETSDNTMDVTMEFARAVGKTPVRLEKFVNAFILNRIQRAITNEVCFLLDNGYATPEQIDLAVKIGLAPRMMVLGVVQRMDFASIDLCTQYYKLQGLPMEKWPHCLAEKVTKGDLGVKTGKGFYDYGGRKMEEILKERDLKLIRVLELLKDL